MHPLRSLPNRYEHSKRVVGRKPRKKASRIREAGRLLKIWEIEAALCTCCGCGTLFQDVAKFPDAPDYGDSKQRALHGNAFGPIVRHFIDIRADRLCRELIFTASTQQRH